ncbi:hypothetical protein RHGRI_010731 [Rhododendron griersonianum]|uniref:Uncharacterized protein n=1 Tax=Rhododendron griersonianum TaxID=479676 RepID=A0AAV6KK97_9ERIC|nr:hypothetical protein RHGRI_010731 [Rhododendron griersonianum]
MFTKKNDHLVKVGLRDLIRLLRNGIPQNPNLIHATLAFWDPSFNCFRFNYGMMAPTVFDGSHILGLLPNGPMFDIIATSSISFSFPDLNSGNSSYTKFLNAEMKMTGKSTCIGVPFKTLNKYHVEVYCPAQFARQFGLVQAVPLPLVGTSNIPIHKRLKLGYENTKHSNLIVGNAKKRFMPQDFTANPLTTLKFTQWWHNSMVVYNGNPLAKKLLKYINAPSSTPKNIAPEGSQTISDDGFGEFDQSDGEKEVEQPKPIAAIPLQSVPPLATFRRKRHTRTLVSISKGTVSAFQTLNNVN